MTTPSRRLPGLPPPPRALVGATLVDGRAAPPVPDAVVMLRDGTIECAGPRARAPCRRAWTRWTRGPWIAPGLVDAHVHFSQTGWADGRPDALDLRAAVSLREVEARAARASRALLPALPLLRRHRGVRRRRLPLDAGAARARGADTLAPHVAAAGPLLSTLDYWLNLPAERQFIFLEGRRRPRARRARTCARGAAAVKVWFIVRPERTSRRSARRRAGRRRGGAEAGLPLIVHATGLREAKVALRAGARLLVHSVGRGRWTRSSWRWPKRTARSTARR